MDINNTTTPKTYLLSEEEVANDFVHPVTGHYRYITDDVPDYIDPKTGHYKFGIRKCSKCGKLKDTENNYTKEQAKKSARKRICNKCIGNKFDLFV